VLVSVLPHTSLKRNALLKLCYSPAFYVFCFFSFFLSLSLGFEHTRHHTKKLPEILKTTPDTVEGFCFLNWRTKFYPFFSNVFPMLQLL
jgi:hypothetical protein